MTSPGLTTIPHDPYWDLDAWVGQRKSTFRFQLIHGPSGVELFDLTPVKTATLRHTTGQSVVRQCNALFGVTDTQKISTLTDRVRIWMVRDGVEYPLGRYQFVDQARFRSTGGLRSDTTLVDEGWLVDQPTSQSFSATGSLAIAGQLVQDVIPQVQAGLPITTIIEPSPFRTIGVWPIGTRRGKIVQDLAIDGDYWAPYFDNLGRQRFKRTFDPADVVPQFDFDTSNKVIRDSITETDDLLFAANRFIVIGNGGPGEDGAVPVVGRYDIPDSAPHSIANRGFVVPETFERQVTSNQQAQAAAQNLGLRQTIYERVELSTAPDPRHDGYDVIRFRGANWLELGWALPLAEGAPMRHVMRKAYLS